MLCPQRPEGEKPSGMAVSCWESIWNPLEEQLVFSTIALSLWLCGKELYPLSHFNGPEAQFLYQWIYTWSVREQRDMDTWGWCWPRARERRVSRQVPALEHRLCVTQRCYLRHVAIGYHLKPEKATLLIEFTQGHRVYFKLLLLNILLGGGWGALQTEIKISRCCFYFVSVLWKKNTPNKSTCKGQRVYLA